MSNGNDIKVETSARLLNLMTSSLKLVQDRRRDAEVLCELLQKFIETALQFNPAKFIGKGWSFAEARDPRSAALGMLDDYSKVKLSTDWLQGHSAVDGETCRSRILTDATHTPLNADHFLDLWTNKEKIPESWKEVKGVITFEGDTLRSSRCDRCVLCLYWSDGRWFWDYVRWLDREWLANNPSAVLAS